MKYLINVCLGLSLLAGTTIKAQETPALVSTDPQNRKILIEEFTGIGCGNCPRAHRTSNGIVAAYPDSAFVINIHQGGYATDKNPDLTTAWGDALYDLSGAKVFGYPAGTINRHVFEGDATFVQDNKWPTTAPEVLKMPSYVNVAAKATIDWNLRKIMVEVEAYYTAQPGASSNFINVALLQDNIRGDQYSMNNNPDQVINGEYNHMHALRDLLTGQWGEEITGLAKGTLVKKTFAKELPEAIKEVDLKLEDLSVIVFVTESHTEVMNVCEAEMTHIGAPAHIVRLLEMEPVTYPACTPEGKAVLRLENILSGTDIKEFTIEASTAAGTQAFDFTPADFAVGTKETIEVGPFPMNWNQRDKLTLRLTRINGEAYTWEDMDMLETPVVKWGGYTLPPVTVNIVQDMFGTDITWTLTRNTETLQSGGPYRDLQDVGTRVNTVTLTGAQEPGCYVFTVFDKNGDGINSDKGEGYIEFKDASGAVVSHMDGKYDSSVQFFIRVTGV
ncbi:MAG: Omp28-related outer membrane protein, partial [Bacteroidales bacterium]|nr:Omp28-related outer membrane protein [Bacteroidales bacterium]